MVDDEPAVLDLLREMLDHLGYDASTAASGEEAIAAMATVQLRVESLDLLMPGISGLEALTYFRLHHRAVQVIVITADLRKKSAQAARAAGAFAVVEKPFDLNVRRGLVAQAMRLAPGQEESP